MKTIKLTLLSVAAVLAAVLNSCRKDASPAPVASAQRDSLSMGPLALRHFKCKDPQKTLSEGLLAWYPFSGNADDWSGNHYNGVDSGATLTTGKYRCKNSAYGFNGTSDYITCPFSFDDTARFSVYARVKRGGNGTIFSKGEFRRVDQVILSVSSDSTSINANLYWQRSVPSVAHIFEESAGGNLTLTPQDRWEDIVVTFDFPRLKIYINRKLVSDSNGALYSPIFPNYNGLPLIGVSQAGYVPSRGFLTGVVDEMRFYKRALTQQEIDYLYRH